MTPASAQPGPAAARHRSPVLDDALAFRLNRTNRLLRTHLARFLARHVPGISPEQWFILARVAQGPRVRQVDLAERVLADPPNVSRLVDALVARGLVRRSPDPADRRSWLLSLTRQGRQVTARLLDHTITERQLVFDGFADDELDALAAALDRIDANLRRLLSSTPPPQAPGPGCLATPFRCAECATATRRRDRWSGLAAQGNLARPDSNGRPMPANRAGTHSAPHTNTERDQFPHWRPRIAA